MRLLVGRIGRAHGVAGEVSVLVTTDDPEARFSLGTVLAAEPPAPAQLAVVGTRRHQGRLLVRFEGVTDRGEAEGLKGVGLYVDSADTSPPVDPDEFWDHQLVGLAVLDPDGQTLGAVVDVVHGPGGDHLVVRLSGGRDCLVPFVKALVPRADPAEGVVVVDAPEGLWDL